ncbi:MAG: ribonuclease H-like domain-containing protein [Vicinamibacterales bacterium]
MSQLADRLRGLLGTPAPGVRPGGPDPAGPTEVARAADALGGEWTGEGRSRFLLVDRCYESGHRLGRVAVEEMLPEAGGAWPGFDVLPGGTAAGDAGPLLFLDLETTGLAGGAGTYAFLVGCGWFDGAAFRVRQFFLSGFTAEAALLAAVETLAARFSRLVTYNGRSFDVPLLENRFALHRMEGRVTALPHVDLLHPARRLWSDLSGTGEGGACRLSTLEREQCGHVREGDVPGFEIPARYFDFVRSGDASPLEPVLEHNRLDLLALAAMTGLVSRMLARGPSGVSSPREALGVGRLLESAGRHPEALACFARAADAGADRFTRVEGLRRLALACRRQRLHGDAAAAWQHLVDLPGCPTHIAREATAALAVHHEHRVRDLPRARSYAVRSLTYEHGHGARTALQYRLARLDRKLGMF